MRLIVAIGQPQPDGSSEQGGLAWPRNYFLGLGLLPFFPFLRFPHGIILLLTVVQKFLGRALRFLGDPSSTCPLPLICLPDKSRPALGLLK